MRRATSSGTTTDGLTTPAPLLEEMAGWGWQKVHHPDHVQRVVDKISKCFQTGEVWEDTFPLRGRDGNYRLFLSRAVPIRDPRRKGAALVRHEHRHQREQGVGAKYRGLLEAAPDAMVVVNQGGEIVLLNVQAEKQFGYSRDELLGQKVKNIIPEGFAERLIADGTRSCGGSTGAADRHGNRAHRRSGRMEASFPSRSC